MKDTVVCEDVWEPGLEDIIQFSLVHSIYFIFSSQVLPVVEEEE